MIVSLPRRIPKSSDRGDTIVEVIISVAVLSSLLIGALATSTKSVEGLRDSEEHSEALQVLKGQVELLRPLSANSASRIYGTTPFCLDNTDTIQTGFGYALVPPLATDNFAQYPSACRDISSLYNVSVAYDSGTGVFTFRARWDSLLSGRDEVQLFYKIKPQPASPPPPAGYTSCDDPGAASDTYFFDFRNFPTVASKDWHVKYVPDLHTVSDTPFTGAPLPIQPGTYQYWAFSMDDSMNPLAANQSLHYLLQHNGTTVFQTADTPDLAGATLSDFSYGVLTVDPGQPITSILVEHAPLLSPPPDAGKDDDSVDGACLVLHAVS